MREPANLPGRIAAPTCEKDNSLADLLTCWRLSGALTC